MTVTVRKLLDDPMLGLRVAAGARGLDRPIVTAELNRPSLELTGYFKEFRSERIQILGVGELTYLEEHSASAEVGLHLRQVVERSARTRVGVDRLLVELPGDLQGVLPLRSHGQ